MMIEVMPETEKNILVVKATAKLTAQDYETVLIPHLEKILEEYGTIKVVLYLSPDFQGWELGAAWDDAKFGVQHRKLVDKIAVVGAKKWLEWITKAGAFFLSGEIKAYKECELLSAIEWVKI
ncbi:MAG: STAS/SEC14 domain-containing protein [Mariprofundaceae bacterium]